LAKRFGVSDEKIAQIDSFRESPLFSEKEKLTLAYADQVTRRAVGVREEDLAELRKHYKEDEIVELTLVICVANCANRFSDALHVAMD
jgi:alkylhydroperoxidase family enzyme